MAEIHEILTELVEKIKSLRSYSISQGVMIDANPERLLKRAEVLHTLETATNIAEDQICETLKLAKKEIKKIFESAIQLQKERVERLKSALMENLCKYCVGEETIEAALKEPEDK